MKFVKVYFHVLFSRKRKVVEPYLCKVKMSYGKVVSGFLTTFPQALLLLPWRNPIIGHLYFALTHALFSWTILNAHDILSSAPVPRRENLCPKRAPAPGGVVNHTRFLTCSCVPRPWRWAREMDAEEKREGVIHNGHCIYESAS
jgi:hypothetical protein